MRLSHLILALLLSTLFHFHSPAQISHEARRVMFATGVGSSRTIARAPASLPVKTGKAGGLVRSMPSLRVNDASDVLAEEVLASDCSVDGNRCTLRAAVEILNQMGSGTIAFDFKHPVRIELIGEPIVLNAHNGDIRIVGPGADLLTVGRDTGSKSQGSIFSIVGRGKVHLAGLTISDAASGPFSPGSCVRVTQGSSLVLEDAVVENCSGYDGGGISNRGRMMVTRSTIRNNNAFLGGGVFTAGPMEVYSSVIHANTAAQGGGVNNNDDFSTTTLVNSTIAGNHVTGGADAAALGGGIFNFGPMDMTNVTIADNSAAEAGAGFCDFASVWAPELSRIKNTLFGRNNSPSIQDVFSYGLISLGHNFASHGGIGPSMPSDIQGTYNSPIDPVLGQLSQNGGITLSIPLLSGSPSIDSGGSVTATEDQRGQLRKFNISSSPDAEDGTDIGAFEYRTPTAQVIFQGIGPFNDAIRLGSATLTDADSGEERTALVSFFGQYRFNDLPTGRSYRLTIRHKRYTFVPITFVPAADRSAPIVVRLGL